MVILFLFFIEEVVLFFFLIEQVMDVFLWEVIFYTYVTFQIAKYSFKNVSSFQIIVFK